MCIFLTQLYQTQNKKVMLNRELELELQSQGTHQDCFSINEKNILHELFTKNILKICKLFKERGI